MVQEREEVTRRIERLEREARRGRLAAVILGGVLGIVGLMGATKASPVPVAEEIRARRFVLVDEAGRERARLLMEPAYHFPEHGLTGEPTPRLNLYDKAGALKVRLHEYAINFLGANESVGSLGSSVLVFSERDKELATLNVGLNWQLGSEAQASLVLRGRAPSVMLVDEQGRQRAVLGTTALETIATGTIEQRPASSLVLFDKDGKVLFKAP